MTLLHNLLVLSAALSTSFVSAVPGATLVSSVLFNNTIPVNKYKTNSGIIIVIAKTDGPLVNGYFYLATKVNDDNGVPHALEHLVFMGSEDYPYKGALDLIANRCYAFGTSAFTSVDRTWYFSSHVGKDGCLAILPVFMDHLLYPTLPSSAFTTEVHHVTGNGRDGGVVYSEQEADMYDYGLQGMLHAVHKDSGYASFTGGALKNLRENTTHQMVVDFHKKFYRPENLCIIICGDVSIDDVMKSIKQMEKKILSKPKLPKWQRPWKTQVTALKTTIVNTIIPSEADEGFAEVYIAWRAPDRGAGYREILAFTFLTDYLGFTSTGADYFASSVTGGVFYSSTLYFQFTDVPVNKLKLVYPAFHKRLQSITKGREKIDLNQIRNLIRSEVSTFSRNLETATYEMISNAIAYDFLYGDTNLDFNNVLNTQAQLQFLLEAPKTYWISLINEYFINKNYAQSNGIPSKAELDRLNKENDELIPKRIQELGPDGLKKKANELAKAIEINSRPVPDSVINSIPLPPADNINYFDVKIYRTGASNEGKPSGLDLDSWPTYAEAYDCRTNYVYITATFFTHKVEAALRPYINLLFKLIYDLPIQHENGEITALNDFKTTDLNYRIGLTVPPKSFSCGYFSQTASFLLQVEKSQYEVGVKYLLAGLQYIPFDASNIKDAASTLLNSIPKSLTNEYAVNDLMRSMLYKTDSNLRIHSMLYQKKFLTSLIASLDDTETAKKILADVLRLRDVLISSSNLAFHVTADFIDLNKQNVDLNGPWKALNVGPGPKTLNVVQDTEVMFGDKTVSIKSRGEIVGIQQETSYLCQSSPGIKDFNDNDLPALTVALAYCTQIEGPMYRRVRGPGYAYSYRLLSLPGEGIIQFQLYRASDIVRAFNETLNIINERTQPNAVWDKTLFDSAKSAAVYQVVNRVPRLGSIQLASILLSFQKVVDTYNEDLVPKILAVSIDDVKRVAQLYMTKIFSAEAKTAIVCNANEGPEIAEGLKKLGFDLPYRTSFRDSFLNKFD